MEVIIIHTNFRLVADTSSFTHLNKWWQKTLGINFHVANCCHASQYKITSPENKYAMHCCHQVKSLRLLQTDQVKNFILKLMLRFVFKNIFHMLHNILQLSISGDFLQELGWFLHICHLSTHAVLHWYVSIKICTYTLIKDTYNEFLEFLQSSQKRGR